jgi:hypothetical protein
LSRKQKISKNDHVVNGVVMFACISQAFQVFPIPFVQVELGQLRKQPDNQKKIFKKVECNQGAAPSTFMAKTLSLCHG